MKIQAILTALALLTFSAATPAFAGDGKELVEGPAPSLSLYDDREFNFDVVSLYAFPQRDTPGNSLGVSARATFMLSRNFGLEAAGSWFENDTWTGTGGIVLRVPFDRLALYGGAGAGYAWQSYPGSVDSMLYYASAGAELRFSRRAGVFSEYRFNWLEDSGDYGQAALGLRFSF